MNNYKQLLFVNKHKIFFIKLWLRLDNDNFLPSIYHQPISNHYSLMAFHQIYLSPFLLIYLIYLVLSPQVERYGPRTAEVDEVTVKIWIVVSIDLESLTIDAWNTSENSNEIYR